jgi:hypothetical protein
VSAVSVASPVPVPVAGAVAASSVVAPSPAAAVAVAVTGDSDDTGGACGDYVVLGSGVFVHVGAYKSSGGPSPRSSPAAPLQVLQVPISAPLPTKEVATNATSHIASSASETPIGGVNESQTLGALCAEDDWGLPLRPAGGAGQGLTATEAALRLVLSGLMLSH